MVPAGMLSVMSLLAWLLPKNLWIPCSSTFMGNILCWKKVCHSGTFLLYNKKRGKANALPRDERVIEGRFDLPCLQAIEADTRPADRCHLRRRPDRQCHPAG